MRRDGTSLSGDEILAVVDPATNEVIGSAPRARVKEENLSHRATYIFIRRKDSELLYVQRRSMLKDYAPGYLDPTTGGCVGASETYEENAVRELQEELGVSGAQLAHLFDFYHAPFWGRCCIAGMK